MPTRRLPALSRRECGLVSRVINSMAFPGAWTRLTPANIGPCATGTQADVLERQTTTIHPDNPHRIYDS
jgi:hypothetical protein